MKSKLKGIIDIHIWLLPCLSITLSSIANATYENKVNTNEVISTFLSNFIFQSADNLFLFLTNWPILFPEAKLKDAKVIINNVQIDWSIFVITPPDIILIKKPELTKIISKNTMNLKIQLYKIFNKI